MNNLSILNVAVALICQNGQILVGKRPAGKIMEGYWELPGGKIEIGEDPIHALKRELFEELGITAKKINFWKSQTYHYASENIQANLNFFIVKDIIGIPYGKEGQTITWIEPKNWQKLNFLPADRQILQEISNIGCKQQILPRI